MTTEREYDRDLSAEDKTFLRIVHDPARRADLLARLTELGLLPAFLEAEGGVGA